MEHVAQFFLRVYFIPLLPHFVTLFSGVGHSRYTRVAFPVDVFFFAFLLRTSWIVNELSPACKQFFLVQHNRRKYPSANKSNTKGYSPIGKKDSNV